jgi:NAD(P)-dependent dehydrogenase (short-subunit alcohol dehydrogenase family)
MLSPYSKSNIVLVTGCSSGLGRSTALAFQNAGWRTVATARNPRDIADLQAHGCETLALDVTDEDSRRTAIGVIEQRYGPVGVLVNNAGAGQYGPLEEVPLEHIRQTFEINVFGLLRLSQLVLPGMRTQGRGRIINVSSLAGRVSAAGGGVYHMTKFAVEAMADAMRPEVKPFGIDVINILPGPFDSPYRDKVQTSIPDTGAHSPYAFYKRSLAKYLLDFHEPGRFGVMSCERVSRVIFKAATTRRPRTRYSVGFYARLGPIGRALAPDRVVDAYMAWAMPHR